MIVVHINVPVLYKSNFDDIGMNAFFFYDRHIFFYAKKCFKIIVVRSSQANSMKKGPLLSRIKVD